MPSQRQIRTLAIAVILGVVFILFQTSHLRHSETRDHRTIQDFYHKTVQGIQNKVPGDQASIDTKDKDGDGNVDADDAALAVQMAQRLKDAEEKAKESANRKAPKPDTPSELVGVGNSAKHQDKKESGAEVEKVDERKEETKKTEVSEEDKKAAEQRNAVEAELNIILKKSPIIIFSKSYCPFSKRAKGLLLDKYNITPAPHVVELDEHSLGPQIQAYLGEKTGRTTVPNILINAVSIGGADDIVALDNDKKLVTKIIKMGEQKIKMRERMPKVKPAGTV